MKVAPSMFLSLFLTFAGSLVLQQWQPPVHPPGAGAWREGGGSISILSTPEPPSSSHTHMCTPLFLFLYFFLTFWTVSSLQAMRYPAQAKQSKGGRETSAQRWNQRRGAETPDETNTTQTYAHTQAHAPPPFPYGQKQQEQKQRNNSSSSSSNKTNNNTTVQT
jgi:hypothetical protein